MPLDVDAPKARVRPPERPLGLYIALGVLLTVTLLCSGAGTLWTVGRLGWWLQGCGVAG
jgi:hypothetical protein